VHPEHALKNVSVSGPTLKKCFRMLSQHKNNFENYQKIIKHAECALKDFLCILRVCSKIYLHAEHAVKTFLRILNLRLKAISFQHQNLPKE
jgi:hypothetical protein